MPEYRARSRHFRGTRPKSRHGEAGASGGGVGVWGFQQGHPPAWRGGRDAGHEELLGKTLTALHGLAKAWGTPLSDLAVAWLLQRPGVACVIAGCTKVSQLDSNIRAAAIKLTPEQVCVPPLPSLPLLSPRLSRRIRDRHVQVAALDAATEELRVAMGPNADLWQGTHADGKEDGRIR